MQLNDRAQHRLRIAAMFLRKEGSRFPDTETFYQDVIDALINLKESNFLRWESLKELVDWVEAYDNIPLAK